MRGRGDRDEYDFSKSAGCVIKDASLGLFKMLCILIVFVLGVVIGLISSSHVDRYLTLQADQLYGNYAPAPIVSPAIYTVDPVRNCTNITTTTTTTTTTPIIVDCKKENCLSMENFVRPKNLSHGMSDDELFWRASLVPDKEEYPFDRVPKVAFMFLTRGYLPFLPLWEEFFRGEDENKFSIYVHALPGYELNVTNASAFYNRQIPSQEVKWGSVSLVDAEKRLMANALLDFSNERFVLLSESCIPLYNFPTVYRYLIGSLHSFIDSYDDPSRYGRGRYSRRMKPDIKLANWRKGSQWFELNRTLAVKVVSDTKYYSLFKKYCLPACYPDEHYIPTFVHMFYGEMNSNRTVTYVDWSQGGPHPASFEAENVTVSFIQMLRSNGTVCWYNWKQTPICHLFARKFKPSALKPLLKLIKKVLVSGKF